MVRVGDVVTLNLSDDSYEVEPRGANEANLEVINVVELSPLFSAPLEIEEIGAFVETSFFPHPLPDM